MTRSVSERPTPSGRDLDILFMAPGLPAAENDDQCLPAVQDFLSAFRELMPEAFMRAVSLHYPFRRGTRVWRGIPISDLGGATRPWPMRGAALARAWLKLSALSRTYRPDLIHAFLLTDAALVASWFSRWKGIPCVATLLGQDALISNRYARLTPGIVCVVAPSRIAEGAFTASFGRPRLRVIPWGIRRFEGALPEWGGRPIDLLGVGSLSGLKDFSTFVRVVAQLHAEGRVGRAVILGDGPERSRLRTLIHKGGIQDVIELRGAVSRREVLEVMSTARVLLHPSRYEGFGLVFAEALSRGMRLVSRPVGFASECPAWTVGDDDEAMLQGCRRQLSARDVGAPPEYPLVSDTVAHYAALYREMLGRAT